MKKKRFTYIALFAVPLALVSCGAESNKDANTDNVSSEHESVSFETVTSESKGETFHVTFLNYDNRLLYQTDVKEGQPAIYDGETPSRPETDLFKYVFSGWDKDLTSIYADTVAVAQYEAISKQENDDTSDSQPSVATYIVTFLNYDSTMLFRSFAKEGDSVSYEGPTPERPDDVNYYYEFIGWDKDLSHVYSDMFVYAQYQQFSKQAINQYDNYNSDMKLRAYIGNSESDLKLSNSVNLKDKYYLWYFNLGTVRRAPLYTSVAIQYDYDVEAELSFEKISSATFETANTHVDETIDTHSYQGGFTIGFGQEVSEEIAVTAGVEASVEADAGFVKAGEKISSGITSSTAVSFSSTESTDHHWTDNWGRTISDSQSVTNGYTQTYREGLNIKLPLTEDNGFKKGCSYRASFYETIRVYGLLTYDVENDCYYVTYENFLEPNQKQLIIEESEDGYYNYDPGKTLTFDVDAAKEIALRNIPEYQYEEPIVKESLYEDVVSFVMPSNTLCIDFSKYQEAGSLAAFHWDYYQNGKLILNPMIGGHTVYGVEIKGAYGHINPENGRPFNTTFSNVSLEFADHWDKDINLTLSDISFSTATNVSAIKTYTSLNFFIDGNVRMLGNGTERSDAISVGGNLSIKGKDDATLYVKANDVSARENGSNGIFCKKLEVNHLDLTVYGGSGGNGASGTSYSSSTAGGNSTPKTGGAGEKGGDGGNGIICDEFAMLSGAKVTSYGGNGGNGGNGGGGEKSNTAGVGRGGAGGAGGAGGNGGNGLITTSVYSDISNGNTLQLTSGNGGNGGNGGAGGEGIDANKRDSGGNGGQGGNGGNSGKAVILSNYDSSLVLKAGVGNGGNGGAGGKGGNAYRDSVSGSQVYIGNGGNGGKGGDALKTISNISSSLVQYLNNPIAGQGGAAGAAGGGGTGVGAIHMGKDGAKGEDGTII